MPIRIFWLDETKKDILQYEFVGKWTWDDFFPIYEEALVLEKEQPHRVDVILDFRQSATIPPNALTHIKSITYKLPDNIGLSIFVTKNHFFQVMHDMAVSIYPPTKQYFVVVKTIEDAHASIMADRAEKV
ncbi:MAG: hypothetical protein AAF126_04925 [Chloroflexota bacterium]